MRRSPFRAFVRDGRLTILDISIAPLDLELAGREVLRLAAAERPGAAVVCATGAHGLVEARINSAFRDVLASADCVLPDGMPLVWIGRAAGFPRMGRVFGPDLMLNVCRNSVATGTGHFLCGGGPGVARELARRLTDRIPGLRICGSMTPPFGALHDAAAGDIARAFLDSGAHILWLGVSTPRQEQWAMILRERIPRGVLVTVGAAFDYHTGRIRRAPVWMQKAGLEWSARLLQDPVRLLPRYAKIVPSFLGLVLLQMAAGARTGAGER